MYYVYLLTNWNNKVLYTGITSNLEQRLYEHKNKLHKGFTEKYNVNKLVFFEETTDVYEAITREKQIKGWKREKKNKLVEEFNFYNSLYISSFSFHEIIYFFYFGIFIEENGGFIDEFKLFYNILPKHLLLNSEHIKFYNLLLLKYQFQVVYLYIFLT